MAYTFQTGGSSGESSNGSITVNTEPYNSGIQKVLSEKRNTDTIIPAGAFYIRVEPIFAGEFITVNGKEYDLGQVYEARMEEDKVNNNQDFLPETTIISNGNEFHFTVAYPSANPIDLSII